MLRVLVKGPPLYTPIFYQTIAETGIDPVLHYAVVSEVGSDGWPIAWGAQERSGVGPGREVSPMGVGVGRPDLQVVPKEAAGKKVGVARVPRKRTPSKAKTNGEAVG